MVDTNLLHDVAFRSGWSISDVVTLLDYTYSLFRLHIINAEVMNTITSWLWSIVPML